jgi:hypothetical protein
VIYKTKVFDRWASDQGLTDLNLCNAVSEMVQGLYDAELGGNLVKKRVARTGQGKRGGFRTLVATNKGDKWFFVFGFAKNEQDNISKKEKEALKKLADYLLALSPQALLQAQLNLELIEVKCHE